MLIFKTPLSGRFATPSPRLGGAREQFLKFRQHQTTKKPIMTNPTKTISTSSLMQENRTFPPSPEVIKRAYINAE